MIVKVETDTLIVGDDDDDGTDVVMILWVVVRLKKLINAAPVVLFMKGSPRYICILLKQMWWRYSSSS